MRYLLILLCVIAIAQSKITFITKQEYASSLYHNPRGVGCERCHGEQAQGKTIASYTDHNTKKLFSAPSLQGLTLQELIDAMNTPIRGMPRYFLTNEEVAILYFYIQSQQSGKKNDTK